MPELLVPAYVHWRDEATWSRIIAARPAVVVINPNSGPDPSQAEPYARIVKLLREQRTDLKVLGYVWCDYFGGRRMRAIRADAHVYRDSFEIDGIFWDGTPTTDDITTRRRLRSLYGTACVSVFNCGAPVPTRWFAMLPHAVFVTFEGAADEYATLSEAVPERACHLVHSAGEHELAAVDADLGYRYTTPGRLPNPWCVF